ncbi:MAG: GxxExxY protein [Bacteroidetes bacterium]|nr:GxxExxY protein [Bacteroidota bacterium]MBK9320969.1 GxxExxY protein [Bacteroidota bacterium]
MKQLIVNESASRYKRSGSSGLAAGATKTENEIATLILDCAVELHRHLGPGLLESAYEATMMHLLLKKGLRAEHQKALPLVYEEVKLEAGYRVDILVEKKVIVEVKSVEILNDVHLAQVMTYLRLSGCKLGLLINFNSMKVMDGVRRVVNKL